MRMRITFKGSGEGHVSRIHPAIRWTCVVITRGRKLTTTDAPSASLSLAGGRDQILRDYMFPKTLREGVEQTS